MLVTMAVTMCLQATALLDDAAFRVLACCAWSEVEERFHAWYGHKDRCGRLYGWKTRVLTEIGPGLVRSFGHACSSRLHQLSWVLADKVRRLETCMLEEEDRRLYEQAKTQWCPDWTPEGARSRRPGLVQLDRYAKDIEPNYHKELRRLLDTTTVLRFPTEVANHARA
jgi:hypothetical protein